MTANDARLLAYLTGEQSPADTAPTRPRTHQDAVTTAANRRGWNTTRADPLTHYDKRGRRVTVRFSARGQIVTATVAGTRVAGTGGKLDPVLVALGG